VRLTDFRKIVVVDTEYASPRGEPVRPVCLAAEEFKTGRRWQIWQDELRRLAGPPFPHDPDTLFVAYSAAAEFSAYLALGWPLPRYVLDLYFEFRRKTNGIKSWWPGGTSLLGACTYHGIPTMGAEEKESMRALVLRGGPWTDEERRAILAYCGADVAVTRKLLVEMEPTL
jgi:DNA polymerase-1